MKWKKKLLSVMLSISMLVGLLPAAAVHAEGLVNPLSATATEVKAGDELEVSFKQPTAMEELTGIEAVLEFDKDAFEATEISTVTFENVDANATPVANANKAGKAGVVMSTLDNKMTLSAGESIVTLKLRVRDDATTGDKKFSVYSYTLGNADGDCTPAYNTNGLTVTVTEKGQEPVTSDVTVEDIADQTYTGKALEPEVVVKKEDAVLTKDTDYTVSYSNNTNVGTAKVTVEKAAEGTVDFTAIEKEFQIKDTYGLIPVMDKIDAIGDVTLDSADAIAAAREAYNALPDEAKQYVTNYQVLVDAEEALEKLQTGEDLLVCWVRAEGDDGTVLPWTKVTMNKNQVPSYSDYEIISGPSDTDFISVLHVLLQGLKDRGYKDQLATVNVGPGGWINDIFGWGMDNLWCLNGIDAPTMSCNYPAASGDMYTFYEAHGNWGGGYGYPGYGFFGEFGEGKDYTPKSAIETIEQTVEVGEAAQFTYLYTSSMHMPNTYGPCNNEDGCTTLVYVSKDGAEYTTDEDLRDDIEVDVDGKFEVTFDTPGTYIVSARYFNPDGSTGACKAYCKVTVKDTYGVADVCAKIGKLKTVTLDSEEAIKDARAAYDALDSEKQQHVGNYALLTDAEAVFPVEQKIAAIGTVTLDSEQAVKTARTAYNGLNAQQKKKVVNYSDLTDAEAVLSVEKAIDAIGEVKLDSKKTIESVRAAYEKLTAAQKKNVVNIAVLDAAEVRVTELLITDIGEVKLDSKTNIEYVRDVYEKLTEAQKGEVANYSILLDAEVTLTIVMIDAVNDGTAATKADIEATRETYDKLTDEQKERVTNYTELVDAEVKLAEKQIADLGTITLESEEAVRTARATYDNLTQAQKNRVSNYGILIRAEVTLTECYIAAIGEVTLDSGNAIKAARADYNALPEAQQKDLVSNYKVLTDAEAVYNVETLIKAIGTGTISTSTTSKINSARNAYNKLTESQQAQVVNYSDLEEAIAIYDVVLLISPLANGVGPDSEEKVQSARDAYDALTAAQQKRVGNVSTLTNGEKAFATAQQIAAIGEITTDSETAIKDAKASYTALTYSQKRLVKNYSDLTDAEKVLPVVKNIAAIGDVTTESEKAITTARTAYDKLTTARKDKVSNYADLTNAEAALPVVKTIDAIGEVTEDSESTITAARSAYDELAEDAKARVSNYQVLVDAEAALEEIWQNDTVTCWVRAEGPDGTVLPWTQVTLNNHYVPSYKDYPIKSGPKDSNYVSVLHALLQGLQDRGMTDELATVNVGSSGWISDMFGWGMNVLWCVKGVDAPVMSCNYHAQEGEMYTFYYAAWGGSYGSAGYGFFGEIGADHRTAEETIEQTVGVGEPAEFNYRYVSSMHKPNLYGNCNNEDGCSVDVYVSKEGAETTTAEDYREDIEVDKEGHFEVTFDEPGTYIVNAHYYNPDGTSAACTGYCKVTVIPSQDLENSSVTIEPIEDQTYTGKAIVPDVVVKVGDKTLEAGKDYKVTATNNVAIGTAKATIQFIKSYRGQRSIEFQIVGKDLNAEDIQVADLTVGYTGAQIKPALTITYGDVALTAGTDYTVTGYKNNTKIGTATVTLKGKGNYYGTRTAEFQIGQKNLSDEDVKITVPELVKYNAKTTEYKPTVKVVNGKTTLKNGTDYTVAYENNTAVGIAKAIITGAGNYEGTVEKEFHIYTMDAKNFVVGKIAAQSYTGSEITPTDAIAVYASTKEQKAGNALKQGEDYTVTFTDNVNVGTAKAVITGLGTYAGSKTVTFAIQPKALSDEDVTVTLGTTNYTYDGYAKQPSVTVNHNGKRLVVAKDYTVTYANNINAATADSENAPTVTVTGTGSYTGTMTFNFTIKPKTSSRLTVTASNGIYNGKGVEPAVEVKDGYYTILKSGVDYTVEYTNNVEITTADTTEKPTATVTFIGNYAGNASKSTTFQILEPAKDAANFVVDEIPVQNYTRYSISPTFNVYASAEAKEAGTALKKNTDYTVTFSNNTNPGTAQAVITGKGAYAGTKTVTFKIQKGNLQNATVTLSQNTITYDGTAKKPTVTVKCNGTTLKDTDYTVKYSNNVNAADAGAKKAPTVTITGKGNYTGKVSATFTITPRIVTLSAKRGITVTVKDAKYTGKALTPSVVVKYGNKTLRKGTDYTVGYMNNVKVGDASSENAPTVIIIGNGNFTGMVMQSFHIYKTDMSSVKVAKIAAQTYTGTELYPEVTVTTSGKNPETLEEGKDYTVTYENNVKVGTGKVVLHGIGDYSGTKTVTFKITK